MKRWLFLAAAVILVAVLGYMPFAGSDVGKLQPVELLRIGFVNGKVTVRSDTGDMGQGADAELAFRDLKATTAGEVFLDTADFLLLEPAALPYMNALTRILRPSCKVCLVDEEVDLKKAAAFLSIRGDIPTLQDYRAGDRGLPYLKVSGERLHLVSKAG